MIKKIQVSLWFCFSLLTCSASQPLQDHSLHEKVGQLLIAHFNGEVANEEARVLIQEIKIGGFIYYNWSNGLTSPQQVLNLSQGLQKLAQKNSNSLPLFIAIDEVAIQAFIAGCDILLLGGKQLVGTNIHLELNVKDVQRIQASLVQAVKEGRLSEARIDQSVEKILA